MYKYSTGNDLSTSTCTIYSTSTHTCVLIVSNKYKYSTKDLSTSTLCINEERTYI